MKDLIKEYIDKCDEVLRLRDTSSARELISMIVSLFENHIPKIYNGLDMYMGYGSSDYLNDIRTLKEKLRIYLATNGSYPSKQSSQIAITNDNRSEVSKNGNSTNTNTNTQTTTVNTTLDIKAELSKIRDEVQANEYISDGEKEEINQKIDEIESVMANDPSNNEKWKKLKSTINWATTKGYKIAQMIMPLVTKAIFPEE